MRATCLLPLGVALLAACAADETPPPDPTPAPRAEAGLEVVRGAPGGLLDFGAVPWDRPGEQAVLLRSTGTADARFEPELDADAGFELSGGAGPFVLPPGGEQELVLRFAPAWDGPAGGELRLRGDFEPVRLVLRAEGLAPVAEAEDVELPDLPVGCSGEVPFEVLNAGRRALELGPPSLETSEGGALTLDAAPAVVLQPGERARMSLRYAPAAVGDTLGLVRLEAAQPGERELRLAVSGHAEHQRIVTDVHVQAPWTPVDLLLIVDNSGSTMDNIVPFIGFLDGLIPMLEAQDVDYRIGVVSTDVGDGGALQGEPPVVTPDLPDPTGQLQQNANLGGSGSGIQRVLDSAWLALQPAMLAPGGANDGFLRDDAMLHLVAWTDEAEQSTLLSGGDPAAYVAFFQSLTAPPFTAVLHDISGGLSGCSGVGGASPSAELVQATQLTGGVSTLICDADYLPAFAPVPWITDEPNPSFPLSAEPLPGTIEVRVEGLPAANWTHRPERGAVVFDAVAVPALGEGVEITYAEDPDCG